jgi:hypothetical protein
LSGSAALAPGAAAPGCHDRRRPTPACRLVARQRREDQRGGDQEVEHAAEPSVGTGHYLVEPEVDEVPEAVQEPAGRHQPARHLGDNLHSGAGAAVPSGPASLLDLADDHDPAAPRSELVACSAWSRHAITVKNDGSCSPYR